MDNLILVVLKFAVNVEFGWIFWSSLTFHEKIQIALISPIVWPVWLCWKASIHVFHKRLVKEGLAKREWFNGLLW